MHLGWKKNICDLVPSGWGCLWFCIGAAKHTQTHMLTHIGTEVHPHWITGNTLPCTRWSGLHPCRGLCSTRLLLTLKDNTNTKSEKAVRNNRFSFYLLTLVRWSASSLNMLVNKMGQFFFKLDFLLKQHYVRYVVFAIWQSHSARVVFTCTNVVNMDDYKN